MRDHVRFFLNGVPRIVRGEPAFASVTDYLRGHLGLCGTKVVCAEGDCGACTVLVGRVEDGRLRYLPIDSCIQFVYQLDGTHVVTVEGLAHGDELHPVQAAMVDCHGSQCGYCTPGIVMALAGWAEDGAKRERSRIALTGNLCRCTGYQPIFTAAEAIAAAPPVPRVDPPEIAATLAKWGTEPLRVETGPRVFFAPTTLGEAIAFRAAHPAAVIVAGGTELGVMRNKRGIDPPVLLSLARIEELSRSRDLGDRLEIGANATWSQVEEMFRESLPSYQPVFDRFGSPQIRHAATLAGNIANGSPIADSLGLLMVLDAELELAGPRGIRRRSIYGFYTGYKTKDLAADELISRVIIPLPAEEDRLRVYKVSRRNDLDIATFGAAIRVREEAGTISGAAIAYTGVAAVVKRMPKVEEYLVGRPFSEATFREAGRRARAEVQPLSDVRGSADFRWQLAENILAKFYFEEVSLLAEALP